MPGYKVVLQDGEIRDELTCSYCKLLLKDPVQASESGLRLCRECYDTAYRNKKMNQNDRIWSDFAVKREIAELKVKCENYIIGCDWKGLFKQLMQHSQECQYVTVECRNPGCGQRVLLGKIEIHLKEECPRRHVSCKDCDKKMCFVELKDHAGKCPNALKACKNCKKEVPACQLADHMIHECKQVRCVCKEDSNVYETGSTEFHDHLQDTGKLADHLGPMICEFTKMSGAFKEMTAAYQQTVKKIDTLEKGHQENAHRIEMLESAREEDAKRIEILEKRNKELEESVKQAEKKAQSVKVDLENKVELLEKQCSDLLIANQTLTQKMPTEGCIPNFQQFNQRIGFLEKRWGNLNDEMNKLKRHQGMSVLIPRLPLYDNELVPYDEFSTDPVKKVEEKVLQVDKDMQELKRSFYDHNHNNSMPPPRDCSSQQLENKVQLLEDKVLELEKICNADRAYYSELILQLQASLASTHNGVFVWHIPDVRDRIRDARLGGTSLYSPPFYTGRNGYKMCMMVYFNGYGTGLSTHLSIFFVLMKGEDDSLLQWPFMSKVSLILVDQDHKNNLVQTIQPNIQSSFQRPVFVITDGCQEFTSLSILDDPSYVKDDVMYIKAIMDTSNILHP